MQFRGSSAQGGWGSWVLEDLGGVSGFAGIVLGDECSAWSRKRVGSSTAIFTARNDRMFTQICPKHVWGKLS